MFAPGKQNMCVAGPAAPRICYSAQPEYFGNGWRPRRTRGNERLAVTRDGQQLWVQGRLWNPRRVAVRIPVRIHIDTGAGEAAIDRILEEYPIMGGQRRTTEAQPQWQRLPTGREPGGQQGPRH